MRGAHERTGERRPLRLAAGRYTATSSSVWTARPARTGDLPDGAWRRRREPGGAHSVRSAGIAATGHREPRNVTGITVVNGAPDRETVSVGSPTATDVFSNPTM